MFDTSEQEAKSQKNMCSHNSEQKWAHQVILESVMDNGDGQGISSSMFPVGMEKFLMETILSSVWSMGKIALAVVSLGIAAEFLEGGRTAHSCFKMPIPISDQLMCSISLQSTHAQLMKSTSLICWDKVLMSNKQHIECVDRSLRDICKVDKPFGGVTVVFGGDPCQNYQLCIMVIVHRL